MNGSQPENHPPRSDASGGDATRYALSPHPGPINAPQSAEVIAVIGGGFSGTVLAFNLLRRCGNARVVLIERAQRFGCGVAYAAHDIPYVLNVPAARLSADSRAPQQFLEFARAEHPAAGPEDFLPRELYGRYLESLLDTSSLESATGSGLERLNDEALDMTPAPTGGYIVHLRHGAPVHAVRVVLAVGMPMSLPPAWARPLGGHPAFHADPRQLPNHLDERHTVLILGNGLTMADVAVNLSWQRSSVPLLHTLSRRGLLPQPQTDFNPAVPAGADRILACATSARQLLRWSRAHAAELQAAGGDWREVVTLIRHLAPRIWRSLPQSERRRFLRHVRAHWDAHRHRMPPQISTHLDGLQSQGKLRVGAGRVLQATPVGDRIRVSWTARGEDQTQSLDVDALINATGPETTLAHSPEPLMQSLQQQDLIAADELALGLRVTADGECVNAAGEPVRNLYYLGPMLRAEHWEATAVTELRAIAEAMAQRLSATVN